MGQCSAMQPVPLCINTQQASEGDLETSLYPTQSDCQADLRPAKNRRNEAGSDRQGLLGTGWISPSLPSLLKAHSSFDHQPVCKALLLASPLCLCFPRLNEGVTYKGDGLTWGSGTDKAGDSPREVNRVPHTAPQTAPASATCFEARAALISTQAGASLKNRGAYQPCSPWGELVEIQARIPGTCRQNYTGREVNLIILPRHSFTCFS